MNKKVHGRHGARWAALQGLYAWQISGVSIPTIEIDLHENAFQFDSEEPEHKVKISFDKKYLHELLTNISLQRDSLDDLVTPYLDRPLLDVHPIEHAILWIALYEFQTRIEIPYKVIINEAIVLAKLFGAQESHKFINGVLDKAVREIRANESIQ